MDYNTQVSVKGGEVELNKVGQAFQIPPLEQMAKVREVSKGYSKGEISVSERMPKKDDRSQNASINPDLQSI